MSTRPQRLELTWIGKENRPKLEPRILLEDPEKSYHAPHRVTDHDIFDNFLIFGDNLLALKALEQERVRYCALPAPEEISEEIADEFELDLAIHPGDRSKIAPALEELNEDGYRLVQDLNHSGSVSALTFAWFENLTLKTAHVNFVFEAPKNRIKVRNAWVADSEIAFACTLLKSVAKKSLSARDEWMKICTFRSSRQLTA